jgi:vesicle-fusing ATPase
VHFSLTWSDLINRSGTPGAGKTALAATIAMQSEFPFIKLVSPESMVGYDENQKIAYLNKVFTDSYKSMLSVVVVDNIERILGEPHRHSCWTLTLGRLGSYWRSLLKQGTPGINGAFHETSAKGVSLPSPLLLSWSVAVQGRRLLIIATTSNKHVLAQMELLDSFQADIHVRAISHITGVLHVVQEMKLFASHADFQRFQHQLQTAGLTQDGAVIIGVKKLLSLIELARQDTSPGALFHARERVLTPT